MGRPSQLRIRPRGSALPTGTTFASSESVFAWAVPDEPEMIAPAWPMRFPGGASNPAMYATTGLVTCSSM